ncbi:MAG TPA: bile acid:sodium symporter, partial [Candidatus Thermoplasmatota archaeon]|nr:bile acid:sodium symporter [Candidatus Thermoplasmatota archaeon]
MASHVELEFQQSALSDVALPLALAVIMLGMGMTLSVADFARVRRMPRAVVAGVLAQFVVLPALGIGVAIVFARFLGLPPLFAVGLILLACCPGGATSNLLAYLARADAALSVTLTSLTSLAAALVTPAAFWLGTT